MERLLRHEVESKLQEAGYTQDEIWNIRYAYESDCIAGTRDSLAQQIIERL